MSDAPRFGREMDAIFGRRDREERNTGGLTPITIPGLTPSTGVEGVPEATESFVSRGLRGIGAGLSPLALPQDILFSILEGTLRPGGDPFENLQEMEWGKYTPWTEAPKRVVTGRDLLNAIGIEDERVSQVGGIVLDLGLDPLIFGAYLRGASKAAGGVEGLMRAADRMDDVAQSVLLAGGVPTARSARQIANVVGRPTARGVERTAAGVLSPDVSNVRAGWAANTVTARNVRERVRGAYYSLTPEPVRQSIQRRMDSLAQFGVGVSYQFQNARINLPGGRVTTPAGLFLVDGGRDPNLVRELSRIEFASGQVPQEVAYIVANLLAKQGDARAKGLLESLLRSQSVHFRQIPERIAASPVSEEMARVLQRSTYAVADQVSPIWALSREALEGMGEAGEYISEARRLMSARPALRAVRRERFGPQENLFDTEIARIREVAKELGDDPDVAADLLRASVDDVIKADAMLGYQSSLLPYVKEEAIAEPIRWLENLKQTDERFANLDNVWSRQAQQDWAAKIWKQGQEKGLAGKLDEFNKQRFPIPRSVARKLRITEKNRLSDDITYRGGDSFALLDELAVLKPQTFFDGLLDGHLRRSFGVFNNQQSYEEMLKHISSGRIIVKNIVDNVVLSPQSNLGIQQPELTEAVMTYLNRVSPTGANGRQFGVAVSQKEVKEYLINNGFGPDEVNDWFMNFIREADDTPAVAEVMTNVRRFLDARYGPKIGSEGLPTGAIPARGAFRQRNMELDEPFLSALLEEMDAGVSLMESAAATQRMVAQKRQLLEIFDYAKQNPKLVAAPGGTPPKGYVYLKPSQRDIYGDLAGQYVHPLIYREINNVMASAKRPNDFLRSVAMLRSAVTGGYLANPATTVTNVLGGFFTAFLYGQNPISLAGEMFEAYNDLRAGNLDDFSKVGALLGDTLSQADIVRLGPQLKAPQMLDERSAVQAMRDFGNNLYSTYQQYIIRKPLGISALGLEPFEMTENLFRVAAYRQAIKRGLTDNQAYDYARFMVFDYGAQPDAVRLMRDSGVVLFPSFPYFMMGRTLNAAWSNPGVLAASDRVSQAIWNANVGSEEEQLALWGGMNDWMRRDQYVPLWPINDPDGNRVGWQFLPLGQMLMTNGLSGFTGDFVTEQLEQGGLWGPLYDIVTSVTKWNEADGTATYGQRFGRQVWSPSANNAEKLQGLSKFFYESFAPGFARKLFMPGGVDEPVAGLVPSLVRNVFTLPGSAGENAQAMMDAYGRMPDRGLAAEIFSTFVRSTRAVTLGGVQGQDIRQPMRNALFEYRRELSDLQERRAAAVRAGKQAEADRLLARMQELQNKFREEFGPYQDMSRLATQVYGGGQ